MRMVGIPKAVAMMLVLIVLTGCGGDALSDAEKAYLDRVDASMAVLGQSMDRFAVLSASADLTSPTWKQQARDEVLLWQAAYQNERDADVPSAFDNIHDAYLAALSQIDSAATSNMQGWETLDPVLIEQAGSQLDAANALLPRVTKLLSEARDT